MSDCNKVEYKYEVELIILPDLFGKNSVINTNEFKEFVKKEYQKEQRKVYDNDINIRDIYPLETYIKNKKSSDLNNFYKLNELILKISKRINRRVTKKKIVYKKDKCKSIISIIITKNNGIKLFALDAIEQYDKLHKFFTIPKSYRDPLTQCLNIKSNEDLNYLKEIINEYINSVLNENYITRR